MTCPRCGKLEFHGLNAECPKRFYFDGLNYIFEKEADGNSRMICEVRGVGDGKFEENAKLLVDALNDRTEGEVDKRVFDKVVGEKDHLVKISKEISQRLLFGTDQELNKLLLDFRACLDKS